jgi:signal recognition particle receptor subunit beta
MALFNHATKELTAKIVFYGPGLCGKTTNLKILHQRLERGAGKLLSLSTAQDRTIYFDLLPIELGNIKGYTVRFQVCTVPGQVFYNETRRIVLRGADGLVFVVDSQWSMLSHNLESFQNLRENLADEKIPLESLPVVIQYNKRDLPSALSVEALQESLGFQSYPYVEAVASEGMGVLETFKLASKLTFVDLLRRLQRGWKPPVEADLPVAETSLGSTSPGSSSGPGASTQPFSGPRPAVSISAPAPEPEDVPSPAPVLAIAGAGAGSVSEEEPAEWIPPSAEGTFADLSDDSLRKASPASRLDAATSTPPAPTARPDALPRFAASSTSGERPRSARPETTAPVTPLDDKLNAVLAEARRAAAGRGSGTFKRDDTAPDAAKAEARRAEALEKAIEKALEAEREERRQLSADLEKRFDTEKEVRDAASLKLDESLEGLQSGMAAATARADEALAAIAAFKTEAGDQRSALAGALAAERAARESAEAAASEAAISLAAQVTALTDRLQAAQAAAEESRATAAAALDRARRIEDVLRTALRDLTS